MEGFLEINRGERTSVGQSGIGYIVVPDDISREQYIEDCYRTSTVTINGGYGYGYISSVKIVSEVLQKINFPLKSTDRGTQVLWIRENWSNRPVVIAIISEDGYTNLLKENQQRIVQKIGDNIVEIFLDANSSVLNINVVGTNKNTSTINIKSVSGSEDSVINVETDGKLSASANQLEFISRKDLNVSLKTSDDTELISILGSEDELNIKDHFNNNIILNEENVNVKVGKKFNIDSGKEPMVLGNILGDLLDELIKAIRKITVISPAGMTSKPVNQTDFINIQNKIENIKSKISNLD